VGAIKVRSFVSTALRPLDPPDGTSIEEQINTFVAGVALKALLDIHVNAPFVDGNTILFTGFVIYQE
jgi:hypothetical protein